MAEDLGEAILAIRTDLAELKAGLKEGKEGAGEMEAKFKQVADGIKDAFAAIGISLSLKAFLDATVEAETSERLLANAVRATGQAAGFTAGQLKAQAQVLTESTAFGDEAIMDMQRALLVFRNIHGEVFTRTTQLTLDFAAATGQDAAGAAKTLGLALNDPINGMSRLSRAGVSVSDALKLQVEQMVRSGDLAGAQSLLLNELEKSYGGTAKAARDTLGGALKALENRFGDLFLEQQGAGAELKKFIELVITALPTVVGVFTGVFVAIKTQIEGVVTNLFHLGQGLNNLVHGELQAAIGSFGQIVNPIKLAANSVAEGVLAFERATEAVGATDEANRKLAATAATTAGVVAAAAAEMNAAYQLQFQTWLLATQTQTALITEQGNFEADAVKMKFDKMSADSLAYFTLELEKARGNGEAMLTIGDAFRARLAAINKARDAAQIRQDQAQTQMRLAAAGSFFNNMQTILAAGLGEQHALTKAAAISAGIVSAFAAYSNALATPLPWPIPGILAGVALAAGLTNVAKMRALEGGGPMARGETALVGEGGPELFTAPRAGFIVPNGEINGGGANTINNNISVAGSDFGDERSIMRVLEGVAQAAKRGTLEAVNAGRALTELSDANLGLAI